MKDSALVNGRKVVRNWHFCDLGDQLPLVGFRIDSGRPEGFAKVRKDFPDGARSFPVGLFNFPVPLSREFARNSLNQRSYSAAKSSDRRLNELSPNLGDGRGQAAAA